MKVEVDVLGSRPNTPTFCVDVKQHFNDQNCTSLGAPKPTPCTQGALDKTIILPTTRQSSQDNHPADDKTIILPMTRQSLKTIILPTTRLGAKLL